MNNITEFVFVYGTLRQGFNNNHLINNQNTTFVGTAETLKKYWLFAKGIPYVTDVLKNSDLKLPKNSIKGELYKIPLDTLDVLDILENHPNWYIRQKIEVINKNNTVKAWLYFNKYYEGTLIKSGDYKDYKLLQHTIIT